MVAVTDIGVELGFTNLKKERKLGFPEKNTVFILVTAKSPSAAIVIVATASPIVVPEDAPESVIVKVSALSLILSLRIGTVIAFDVSFAANVSVPDIDE